MRSGSMTRVRRRRLLALIALGAATSWLGCGSAAREAAFYDATALRDERYQAGATPPGPVWLRRAVEVRVGTARSPENGRATLRFHGARLRFDSVDEARAQVTLTTPAGARLLNVRARVLDGDILNGDSERAVTPLEVTSARGVGAADPDDLVWRLAFADISGGAILEYTAEFEVTGTLVTDARWLGAPDGSTREILVRYDVPDNVVGALSVSDPAIRALARKEGGYTILAVLARHLGPAGPERPQQASIRYVTKRAGPAGFDQSFAESWEQVALPYVDALIERSPALRENHTPPFSPVATGEIGMREAYRWVRARIQSADALSAGWRTSQPLPTALQTNTLTGTDKVHLLHWLLQAAGIPHRLAVARRPDRPALSRHSKINMPSSRRMRPRERTLESLQYQDTTADSRTRSRGASLRCWHVNSGVTPKPRAPRARRLRVRADLLPRGRPVAGPRLPRVRTRRRPTLARGRSGAAFARDR